MFNELSNVNDLFGNVIVNGIFGRLGFVLILMILLLLRKGIIVSEFRMCFIIICLGLCIEVRLYVLFYLFISSI